jgi:hypothetical protein
MRELSEHEISMLNKCSAGVISKEELEADLKYKASPEEMEGYLDMFLNSKATRNFEAVLWNMPNTLSKQEENKLFAKYLLLDGHFEHENIATAFQTYFHTEKENITILLGALQHIPEYLDAEDMRHPYLRKIIYAIGAQPEPFNIEALNDLVNTGNSPIKELALHQIEKRKRLGRWETKGDDNR